MSLSNGLEKYPKLRFPEFTAPWFKSTVGSCFTFQNGKAHENNVVENGQFIIVNSKFISSDGTIKKYSNDLICPLKKDDIVMVMSDVPNGKAMSKCFLIPENDKYTLNQRICSLSGSKTPLFHLYQISRNHFYLKFDDGVSQTNLKKEDVLNCPIYNTGYIEQDKISSFLALIDKKIESQQQLVELLKKYKKGMETVLFSTSSQEQNSWKNVPLKNIGYFFGGLSGKTKDDFGHGEGSFITYMNAYSNTFAKEDILMPVEINKNEKQNTIRYGDIIFTQSSETTEDVGLSSVWLHSSSPYLNSFCMALRPYKLDEIDPIYMGFVLRSNMIRAQIMKAGQGISRINLSSKRIENICIPIPSLEKQKEIGNFLFMIESQIKINSDLIEKLSIEKKGLLQQLFI